MQTHVRALAILQIVSASIGLFFAILVFMFFGGLATIVGLSAPPDERIVAAPILALIGTFGATVIIFLSLPRLIAGIGLLKSQNWARILTLIVSVLGLADFPVGTGLGIYALWVLTRPEASRMFDTQPVRTT